MKLLRKAAALLVVSALLISLTGCFGIYKKIFGSILGGSDETDAPRPSGNETVADTGIDPGGEGGGHVAHPSAGGEETNVYDLWFEVPEGTVKNPYSGLLGVWEFYTDDLGQPGVDINIQVSGLGDKTVGQYVSEDSKPAKSQGVTPFVEETINGRTWYTCNNGTIYYFASGYDGYIYEIEVKSVAGDPKNLRDTAISMLRMTLVFDPAE